MRKWGIWALILCVLGVVGTDRLAAQTATATIQGTVTDASGGSIPGATITVKNLGTAATQMVQSDAQGRYNISNLPVGNYELQATQGGFQTVVHRGLVLTVGGSPVVDFSLPVGQAQQTVTVEGAVSQVETSDAAVGVLTDQKQMAELPLNGRNFEQLILLAPGVQSVSNFTSSGFQGRAAQYSIGGARPEGQAIVLDDESLQNFWNKGMGSVTGSSLGVEAIGEFQTLTNSYGAQFGGNGGVINSVSKSGTNAFHGSAYEFLRNDDTDAFDTFAKTGANPLKPPLHQNQFGATLGGPVKKDKAFFFMNYEGIQRTLGEVKTLPVPDCTAANAFTPGGGGNCAPSATLPAASQTSIINTLKLYPAPNAGTSNGVTGIATEQASQTAGENYGLGRFDYNYSDKDAFFARSIVDKTNFMEPFGGGGFGGAGGGLPLWPESDTSTALFNTVEWRRIVSPTMVNVARMSFTRTLTDAFTSGSTPVLQSFFPGAGRQDGQVTFGGQLAGIGGATQLPFNEAQNRYTEGDDITWTHGAQTMKFGAAISRLQTNTYMPFRQGSTWAFASLSGFLAGQPTTVSWTPLVIPAGQPGAGPAYANRDFRDIEVTPYFQDDWKVSQRLTLNLGVRWSFITNPVDEHNDLYAITDFATATGFTNVPHPMAKNPTYWNFDPRFGFAFDPFKDHKTSIRGGFGMFHDLIVPASYAPAYWDQPPYTTFQAGISLPGTAATYPVIPTGGKPLVTSSPGFDWGSVTTTPYIMQYNLNIQHEIWGQTVLTVGYVGSRGVHELGGVEQNPITLINGTTTSGFNAAGTAVVPNPRLNPNLGSFPDLVPTSNSRYNSMQANATRRFSKNFQAQVSYTYSKCIDNGSYFGSFNNNVSAYWENPYNQSYDTSVCNYDITNTLRINGLYALPFHGNRVVEGWQISGIITSNSGLPFTVYDGVDSLGFTTGVVPPRPNSLTGNVNPTSGTSASGVKLGNTGGLWFDPTQFAMAPIGTWGNLGRDSLRGPGFNDTDIAVTKMTKIREGLNLQFRAEFFNLFNHPNYGLPITSNGTANIYTAFVNGVPKVNPTAGKILYDVGTPRQMQFALKLIF